MWIFIFLRVKNVSSFLNAACKKRSTPQAGRCQNTHFPLVCVCVVVPGDYPAASWRRNRFILLLFQSRDASEGNAGNLLKHPLTAGEKHVAAIFIPPSSSSAHRSDETHAAVSQATTATFSLKLPPGPDGTRSVLQDNCSDSLVTLFFSSESVNINYSQLISSRALAQQ